MTALQEEEEGDKVAGDTQVEEALALWSLYTYTQQNYLLHLTHPWGVGEAFKETTAGHCGIPTCAPLITSPLTNELLLNMIILRTGISQERTFNVFSASGLRKSKN